jgi:hypothetical protein
VANRQVLGREQHRPQDPGDVARRRLRPVEPGPVRPARRDLQLQPQLTAVVHDDAAHHGVLGAAADQRRIGGDPVR